MQVQVGAVGVYRQALVIAQEGMQELAQRRDQLVEQVGDAIVNFGQAIEVRERKIQEQKNLGLRHASLLKIAALASGILCVSAASLAIASFIAQAPVWTATASIINAVAFGVFSHDLLQISKNIKMYVSSPLLAFNIIRNQNFKYWEGAFIFSKTLMIDRAFLKAFKNLL